MKAPFAISLASQSYPDSEVSGCRLTLGTAVDYNPKLSTQGDDASTSRDGSGLLNLAANDAVRLDGEKEVRLVRCR